MWLYDTWFYQHVLNAQWFIWIIIYLVFGFNFLAPIIILFALAEKRLQFDIMKYVRKITQSDESTGS